MMYLHEKCREKGMKSVLVNHISLYFRELCVRQLLYLALWVAPKRLELLLGRAIYQAVKEYAEQLRSEL